MPSLEIIYNLINTYTELLNSGSISVNEKDLVRDKIYQLQIVKVDLERFERLINLLKEKIVLSSSHSFNIYLMSLNNAKNEAAKLIQSEYKLLKILGCREELY